MGTPEEDYRNLPWCHVYASYCQHSPVRIEGNRKALEQIKATIDTALTSGMDGQSDSLFSTDGEGYRVEVKIRNHEYLENTDLPYIAPFAGGVGARCFEQEMESRRQTAAMRSHG